MQIPLTFLADITILSRDVTICVVLLKYFVGFLIIRHCFCNKQTLLFIANMFDNQRRSIISAHVITIEILKLAHTSYEYGRRKWIDTIKRFQ